MSWIIIAIGVILSSVLLYLFVRKAKIQNISLEMQNFGMFFLPALFIFIYNLIAKVPFVVPIRYLVIMFATAVCFSWVGNIFSLKALESAPNPGYSLIISKSYVVLTTILSIWLFRSTLHLKDVAAIALIVGFSAVIVISKSNNQSKSISWLFYTFGAFLAWAFLALTLTYLISVGLKSTQIIFYLMSFVSLLIIFEFIFKKININIEKDKILTLLAIGASATVFNLCLVLGYKLAPNPGYINAANAGSISLVTIFSALIFKDDLSVKKIVGIIGVLCGLVLLFIK